MKPTENSKQAATGSELSVTKAPVDSEAGTKLIDVLGQTEHVKDLVDQSAQELSSVNTGPVSYTHLTLPTRDLV